MSGRPSDMIRTRSPLSGTQERDARQERHTVVCFVHSDCNQHPKSNKEDIVNESRLDSDDDEHVGSKEEKETPNDDEGNDESAGTTASPPPDRYTKESWNQDESLLDRQVVHSDFDSMVGGQMHEEIKGVQPVPECTQCSDENIAPNEPFDLEKDLDLPRNAETSVSLEEQTSGSEHSHNGEGKDDFDIEKGVALQWDIEDGFKATDMEEEVDGATRGQSAIASESMRREEEEENSGSDVEAAPGDGGDLVQHEAAQVPGAVRVLGIDGNPLADLAGSGDEESSGESTVPEAMAEFVDREEEERKMRESVTRQVQEQMIHDAPVAHVITPEEQAGDIQRITTTCSQKMKRRRVIGGIAFSIAIAIGVSLGITLTRDEITRPLDELLSSVSFDGGKALRTPSTPQNMAYEWLANNTNLATYTDERKIQRYTLATFYYSTNGSEWNVSTNWLNDGNECRVWQTRSRSLACTADGEVVKLDLWDNNLVGRIPPEVALLSNSLATLDLDGNELSGSILSEIGLLTAMTTLRLYDNQLSGSIPSEISHSTAMVVLWLDDNTLTGPIPSEIGHLSSLEVLRADNNTLTGSIPSEVSLLTTLKVLSLNNNALTGFIPSEVGDLIAMNWLVLSENEMTGTIPLVIHNMTRLDILELYDNAFTGTFTCPEFISFCGISCPSELDDDTCRSL